MGENFGKFGEMNAICQYFIQPNSRSTKVANVSNCKFANIFLAKTHKTIDLPKFTSPKICIIGMPKASESYGRLADWLADEMEVEFEIKNFSTGLLRIQIVTSFNSNAML